MWMRLGATCDGKKVPFLDPHFWEGILGVYFDTLGAIFHLSITPLRPLRGAVTEQANNQNAERINLMINYNDPPK